MRKSITCAGAGVAGGAGLPPLHYPAKSVQQKRTRKPCNTAIKYIHQTGSCQKLDCRVKGASHDSPVSGSRAERGARARSRPGRRRGPVASRLS
ncbi:hypothetical protein EVAR_65850_1 [Eumeta japonica]|uniref:Uncharacterized protein n=1 Tax=Eumeta variegata TaxID=151549 RepID=A0A4C2A2S4_EUMVA|nr:hypothetical protein EVAR_65850_1 [Eumeta japonica]